MLDQLHRFIFDELHVRGELVRLDDSIKKVISAQEYPRPIQALLGELAAATALLTATLKFTGEISLQVQSEGALKYAVINSNDQLHLRGVARWEGEIEDKNFQDILSKGFLAITIQPEKGERYQGIVALDKPTLAECIEGYFEQSEQLPTKVRFYSEGQGAEFKVGGLFLQVLPQSAESSVALKNDDLEHLWHLGQTLTSEELFALEIETLLYRLFNQEDIELFAPEEICFKCTCSKERSAAALKGISKAELLDIVKQEGSIKMNCQYCHAEYNYDAIDVEAIHSGQLGSDSLQ